MVGGNASKLQELVHMFIMVMVTITANVAMMKVKTKVQIADMVMDMAMDTVTVMDTVTAMDTVTDTVMVTNMYIYIILFLILPNGTVYSNVMKDTRPLWVITLAVPMVLVLHGHR
jgi:hypothetical protein